MRAADEYFSRSEVYRAVVASRNRSLEHLLQIPADEILIGTVSRRSQTTTLAGWWVR
ncbi:hypothetical protein SVIOM74S_04466 [Streptomyces violarus]